MPIGCSTKCNWLVDANLVAIRSRLPSAATSSALAEREFWYCSMRARSCGGTSGMPLSRSVGMPATGFMSGIFETGAAACATSNATMSMGNLPHGQWKRRRVSPRASAKRAAAYPFPGSSG